MKSSGLLIGFLSIGLISALTGDEYETIRDAFITKIRSDRTLQPTIVRLSMIFDSLIQGVIFFRDHVRNLQQLPNQFVGFLYDKVFGAIFNFEVWQFWAHTLKINDFFCH